MVALTDTAKTVIRRLITNADNGSTGLRIMVEQGGCSGMQYMLGLESAAQAGDEVYDFEDVRIYVDPLSLPIVDGMRIDYVEGIDASGFVFDNPNVGNVCSCGKSFAS
jgi:iron-sulfur cluster assembly protein